MPWRWPAWSLCATGSSSNRSRFIKDLKITNTARPIILLAFMTTHQFSIGLSVALLWYHTVFYPVVLSSAYKSVNKVYAIRSTLYIDIPEFCKLFWCWLWQIKYIQYIPRVPQCLSPRPNWTPHPLCRKLMCLSPEKRGRGHTGLWVMW